MIDTHAHIDFDVFDEDRAEMLERASALGVEYVIIPAVEPKSFEKIQTIANQFDNVFCALGVHPHNANEAENGVLDYIEQNAKNKKVLAIGEIGLDYYYDFTPKEVQKEIFRKQLQIAKKLNLPVIVHNREADDDLLNILSEEQDSNLKGVLHCFSSSVEVMEKAVDFGFNISFTGNITFKKINLGEVVINTPMDKILLETDSPFMTPVPNRGKRNEPAFVKHVAEKIAEYKSISLNEVISMTTNNAKKLFNLALMALFIMSSITLSYSLAQDKTQTNAEEVEVNPYEKLVGICPFVGTNTIVRTYHLKPPSGDIDVTFDGILAVGGSAFIAVKDYCIIEVGYLYSKNNKIAILFPGVPPTTHNIIETTSHWVINPYSRVNVFATIGTTVFFNSINGENSTKFGLGAGLGFFINLPLGNIGLFNLMAEWRLDYAFGSEKDIFQNKNGGLITNITSSAFYSIPRLGLIWYPKIKK